MFTEVQIQDNQYIITSIKGDTLGGHNSLGITFIASNKDSSGVLTPIDLTGAIIKADLIRNCNSPVVHTFDSVAGNILTPDLNIGQFTFTGSAVEMANLAVGNYQSDIQITVGQTVHTWAKIQWNHQKDVSA